MYWHSFSGDLTEGKWGGKLRHGRGRVWINRGTREESEQRNREFMSIGAEWALLWDSSTAVYVEADPSDHEWTFHAAIWKLASVWVHVEARWLPQPKTKGFEGRQLGIAFHDGMAFWHVWRNPSSWSRTDGWRNSTWHWKDQLFGKPVYNSEALEEHLHVPIPLPEGVYEATVIFTDDTWRRPRWYARFLDQRVRRAHIKPLDWPDGTKGHIPYPGKHGGKDGLYDMTTSAKDLPEAIAATVQSVLRSRWRNAKKLAYEPDLDG